MRTKNRSHIIPEIRSGSLYEVTLNDLTMGDEDRSDMDGRPVCPAWRKIQIQPLWEDLDFRI